MTKHEAGPDLPGDENFKPLPPEVEVQLPVRCPDCPERGRCRTCGGPRALNAIAMTIPAAAQAAQHHNALRYAELQKLRMAQANLYHQTRYRH